MDDQMTPEAWATMQKLSGSVRLSFIFILDPMSRCNSDRRQQTIHILTKVHVTKLYI